MIKNNFKDLHHIFLQLTNQFITIIKKNLYFHKIIG
jgi:hypothetical protein